MPFSMIVVATSTSISPSMKLRHDRLELGFVHLAVADRDARLGHELLERARDAVDRLDAVVEVVDLAAAVEFGRDRALHDRVADAGTTTVLIDMRFFGAVRISERSRTPISDICSVRGIGVAESVSTSTEARSCLSRSLCMTPKRCSSSTTISPRSRKTTSFCKQPVRADDDVDLAVGEVAQDRLLLLLAS